MYKPESLILTAGPSITEKEINYCKDAVENGWNENWNLYINKFEKTLAQYVNCEFAHSTSSCTGGMHLALLAAGVGEEDEVLVPEITWVATASVVKYVGAKPVFVDIDKHTWTMDPDKIEQLITKKTKAIMPVHLYGHPAEMDKICEIAKKHNLLIIEDAAPSIGAEFKGRKTGSFGNAAVFSFQGAKLLVTGEGGMIVSNDKNLIAKIEKLNAHGRAIDPPAPFWIDEIGYKYKMSNVQAALGLAQLERIEDLIQKKRHIFNRYFDNLSSIDGLLMNKEAEWAKSIYWMSSIYLEKEFPISRNELMKKLKEDKIDSRAVFPAISQYPMWETQNNPVAKHIGENSINLPSGYHLKDEQIDYISERIKHHLDVK